MKYNYQTAQLMALFGDSQVRSGHMTHERVYRMADGSESYLFELLLWPLRMFLTSHNRKFR